MAGAEDIRRHYSAVDEQSRLRSGMGLLEFAHMTGQLARCFPGPPARVLDIGGDAGCKKPEPEIYRRTLAALGLPAEACVFVDDRPGNLQAAAALGMRPVHFYKGGPLCDAPWVEDFAALAALLEA